MPPAWRFFSKRNSFFLKITIVPADGDVKARKYNEFQTPNLTVLSPQKLRRHPLDLRRGGGSGLVEHNREGAFVQGGLELTASLSRYHDEASILF